MKKSIFNHLNLYHLCLGGLVFLACSGNVFAEAIPQSTAYDKRVKDVDYNPDNVTRINVAAGIATLIQFSPSEHITATDGGAAIGDPLAWKVNIRGNNVWLRPSAPDPDTNLTIVTNKRTYLFNLVSVKNRNRASWGVRFNYPEPKKKTSFNPFAPPCSGGTNNHSYFVRGNSSLFPAKAWDNGVNTCIQMPAGAETPVVFKKLPNGSEVIANSQLENGYIVIQGVNPEFRLRFGNQVAALKTNRFKALSSRSVPARASLRPCQGGTYNYRYFVKGDRVLFPLEVWDNGIFTCMAIPAGADMPVVFKKLPDGSEGLVNSHVENGYIVIHEINPEFRLRLGDLVAGVKTDRLRAVGVSNTDTTNGKIRGIINE